MKRDDDSIFLLWLEPRASEKLKEPVNDELTALMERALSHAREGTSDYSDDTHIDAEKLIQGNPAIKSEVDRLRKIGFFSERYSYGGVHITECGQKSTNVDYMLVNGMITNSLAIFYLRWYRNSIPENDMIKLQKLKEFYELRDKADKERMEKFRAYMASQGNVPQGRRYEKRR